MPLESSTRNWASATSAVALVIEFGEPVTLSAMPVGDVDRVANAARRYGRIREVRVHTKQVPIPDWPEARGLRIWIGDAS